MGHTVGYFAGCGGGGTSTCIGCIIGSRRLQLGGREQAHGHGDRLLVCMYVCMLVGWLVVFHTYCEDESCKHTHSKKNQSFCRMRGGLRLAVYYAAKTQNLDGGGSLLTRKPDWLARKIYLYSSIYSDYPARARGRSVSWSETPFPRTRSTQSTRQSFPQKACVPKSKCRNDHYYLGPLHAPFSANALTGTVVRDRARGVPTPKTSINTRWASRAYDSGHYWFKNRAGLAIRIFRRYLVIYS